MFCQLLRHIFIREAQKGGILIEFTFSIPVCIALLFFVNDHYRLYELKNKLKNSAYMAASMVQHVTNTRTDKQLTKKDLARIAYASCLNLFHTNSMFDPWLLGIYFAIDFDWIKKISGDKYRWQRAWGLTSSGNSPENMGNGSDGTFAYEGYEGTLSQLVNRYPELKPLQSDLFCYNNGDERLVISCYYRPRNFNKSKLGLFLMNPSFNNYDFGYHLIIIPKPGLFPVK